MNLSDILSSVHYIAIYQYLSTSDLVALSKTNRALHQDFKSKPAEFWMSLCQLTSGSSPYCLPKRPNSPYHMKPVHACNLKQYCEATESLYLRHITPYGAAGFWDKALHPCTTFYEFFRFLLHHRTGYEWGCSLLLYPDYHRLLRSRFVTWRFFMRRFRKSLRRLQKHLRIVVIHGRHHRLATFSQPIASVAKSGDFIVLQAEDDPFADRHHWSRFQIAFVVLGRGSFQHVNGRQIWKEVGPESLTLRDFIFEVSNDDPIAALYPAVASFLRSGRTISAFMQEFGLTFFSANHDSPVRHSSDWASMTPLMDAWERHLRQVYGLDDASSSRRRLFSAFFKQAYSIGLSLDLFWAAGRYGARLGILPKNHADLWPVPVRAFDTMTEMFNELDQLEFPDRSPYDFMAIHDPVSLFYF